MRILVLDGPNLNMLGSRQPAIYGETTLQELESDLRLWAARLGVSIEAHQSNHEGEMIEAIQASSHDGIVLNPGALTHTSRAIADAVRAVGVPTVEVHISNIREREAWRAVSAVSEACVRTIYGRGIAGYRHAVRHLVNRSRLPFQTLRYGPHPANVADLRRGRLGVVVLVHGGFWRHEWERDTMETLAVDLTRRGFTTWNVEYRRLGDGGGWPGSAHDVTTALDHIPQLGLAEPVAAIIGHSSGAPLALWSSSRSRVTISAAVLLAPLTNLRAHAGSGLEGAAEARSFLEARAPEVFLPDPTRRTLVVNGKSDRLVPEEHSVPADDREVETVAVPGGHFDLLAPKGEHWERAIRFIEQTDLAQLSTGE